jgi:HPt (histidine-containing phosphotransfer) domain-containing protein
MRTLNMTDNAAAKYRSIDWPALVAKLGGDETLALTLLGIAQRSSAAMPADLRVAADAANFDAMSRLAHKLKGTCGDICAQTLREQAAATELAARASAPDAASRARDLADSLDAFLHELQAAAS